MIGLHVGDRIGISDLCFSLMPNRIDSFTLTYFEFGGMAEENFTRVVDEALCHVSFNDGFWSKTLKLYRGGVLADEDSKGSLEQGRMIVRDESLLAWILFASSGHSCRWAKFIGSNDCDRCGYASERSTDYCSQCGSPTSVAGPPSRVGPILAPPWC